jgi:hypothetical protein
MVVDGQSLALGTGVESDAGAAAVAVLLSAVALSLAALTLADVCAISVRGMAVEVDPADASPALAVQAVSARATTAAVAPNCCSRQRPDDRRVAGRSAATDPAPLAEEWFPG